MRSSSQWRSCYHLPGTSLAPPCHHLRGAPATTPSQGFVRVALEEGAWLVPVLAIGETLQVTVTVIVVATA
jgi:hypothetical protein